MPTTISRDEVERIATLARIALTDSETVLFAGQLAGILAYAEQIGAVDTSGVTDAMFFQPVAAAREDVVQPSLDRAIVLASAPDADAEAGFFKVPRVLG